MPLASKEKAGVNSKYKMARSKKITYSIDVPEAKQLAAEFKKITREVKILKKELEVVKKELAPYLKFLAELRAGDEGTLSAELANFKDDTEPRLERLEKQLDLLKKEKEIPDSMRLRLPKE